MLLSNTSSPRQHYINRSGWMDIIGKMIESHLQQVVTHRRKQPHLVEASVFILTRAYPVVVIFTSQSFGGRCALLVLDIKNAFNSVNWSRIKLNSPKSMISQQECHRARSWVPCGGISYIRGCLRFPLPKEATVYNFADNLTIVVTIKPPKDGDSESD